MKSWKSPPKRILYVCGTSSFLMLVKSMTTLTTEVLLLQFRNHGVLFVYVYLCKRKNKTFIDCNLFCRNNTWGICTFIIIVESTVKTAKNTTTNCLNCNIQTSEDEKVKIVCYSPKKKPTCCKQNTRSETLVHDKPFMWCLITVQNSKGCQNHTFRNKLLV